MLRIRLTRVGRKNLPHYRIVVAEHTEPVKGKFIEILGNYNPLTKATVLDGKKALEWMNKGAKPSNMVAKILKRQGLKHKSIVIEEFHKKPKAEAKKTETAKPASKPAETQEKPAETKPVPTPRQDEGTESRPEPVSPDQGGSVGKEKAEQPIAETPEKKEEKPAEQTTKEDSNENKSDVSSQGQPTA